MILLKFHTLDSTQSFLKRHPELNLCGVIAETQSDGRGRWGNRWESQPGAGLYLSAAIRDPELPPGAVMQRAMLHVVACLGAAGLGAARLGLKWPNDLVAWKEGSLVKLGGIIGELDGDRLILGLGVNLRTAPMLEDSAMPAASLADLGLPVPNPEPLALSILAAWDGLPPAPEPAFRWPAHGDAVRWKDGQGMVLGWEEDGRLRVANQAGIQRLVAGDVVGLRSGSPG